MVHMGPQHTQCGRKPARLAPVLQNALKSHKRPLIPNAGEVEESEAGCGPLPNGVGRDAASEMQHMRWGAGGEVGEA